MGDLEAKVLYAIVYCRDEAYGVSIWDAIHTRTGEDLAMGAIYATLDRLEKKKYVTSSWSDPTPARGGRRKRLFLITGTGERSLLDYDERFQRMSKSLRPLLKGASANASD